MISNLNELPLPEREFFLAGLRVWRHCRRVVVEERDEDAGVAGALVRPAAASVSGRAAASERDGM